MTDEQIEVLNITQQVLKNVLLCLAAANPGQTAALSTMLAAAAANPILEPMSRTMLTELSQGMGVISSLGQTKQ